MTCLCVTKRKKENFQLKLWTILLSTSAIKKYLLKSINLSLLYTRSPLLYHQSHHHRSSSLFFSFHFKIYSSSAFYIHSCFIVATSCSFFVDDQQKLSKWTLPWSYKQQQHKSHKTKKRDRHLYLLLLHLAHLNILKFVKSI